jgi:hypothetical protein
MIGSNNLKSVFEKIEYFYDIKVLFSLGLYHKFENVKRVYLDIFDKKGIDLFIFLIGYISNLILDYFSDSLYICMIYSDKNNLLPILHTAKVIN